MRSIHQLPSFARPSINILILNIYTIKTLYNANKNENTMIEVENSKKFSHACAPSNSPLANYDDFTGTSQPMLGVLFFPLIPWSHKGATHNHNQNTLASSSPCKVELPPSLSSWVSQLSQVNLVKEFLAS
jgi:hypothetical protein